MKLIIQQTKTFPRISPYRPVFNPKTHTTKHNKQTNSKKLKQANVGWSDGRTGRQTGRQEVSQSLTQSIGC
jgi:hypothetical protein